MRLSGRITGGARKRSAFHFGGTADLSRLLDLQGGFSTWAGSDGFDHLHAFRGDALAVALSGKTQVQEEDFANLHPGGKLGKRLARVESLMLVAGELV